MPSLIAKATQSMAAKRKARTPTKTSPSKTLAEEEASTEMEDIERVVDRNIVRMFSNTVPSSAIDVVQVDGLSMRARMVKDS